MRRKNSYNYKSSYGSKYYRSSYKRYGYKRSNPVKIIFICLLAVLVSGGAVLGGAYFGLFGDDFRFGQVQTQESVSADVKTDVSRTEISKSESSPKEKELTGKWAENVFIYGTQGFEIFNSSDETAKEYAKNVSDIRSQLDDSINVYLLIAPSHSYFDLPDKYKALGSDEEKSINLIYSSVDKNVKVINVNDALKKHKSEKIYFGTDNNWTALGAYYAYESFCKSAGVTPVELKSLESGSISGFKGSLHAATVTDENVNGCPELDQNPDTLVYYKTDGYCRLLEKGESEDREVPMIAEFASGENAYSAFIWGNNPYMKIQTQLKTNRKLCIIKDSFGCAFAPFTAADFDEVFIVDPAYYDGNIINYIEENDYTDVLILNSTSTANITQRNEELETIIK